MTLNANLERVCSHLPGVVQAVAREGEQIAARARGRLAEHRVTGTATILVTHHVPDTIVSLVDPAAVSIEFGRNGSRGRGASRGLHVLGREL